MPFLELFPKKYSNKSKSVLKQTATVNMYSALNIS